jgi:hypothetical protein
MRKVWQWLFNLDSLAIPAILAITVPMAWPWSG